MVSASSTETVEKADDLAKPPFLRRVRIRGYKSIAFCDVTLEPLTILVGRNASGKSNFLDALVFLRDVMALGVTEAVKRRGGWSAITCRTSDAQRIEMEIVAGFNCGPFPRANHNGPSEVAALELNGQAFSASYHLELEADASSAPIIGREALELADASNRQIGGFEMQDGIAQRWVWAADSESAKVPHVKDMLSRLRPDHPLLGVLGTRPIIDLWAGLRYMAFYNFNPDAMRPPQRGYPGFQLLERDGSNLAHVIAGLNEIDLASVQRVRQYLTNIVDQIDSFAVAHYGEYEAVRFRLHSASGGAPVEFDAAAMSDGTLRALAALVAAFQIHLPIGPSVVGIEEPETSLHPAAMRALVAALDEATLRTQILLTTHSPDLLDAEAVKPKNVRVVEWRDGSTAITPLDEVSVGIVRDRLNTLGGLERDRQMELDLDDLDRQADLARRERDSV